MSLQSILQKYAPQDLRNFYVELASLQEELKAWANDCLLEIVNSGSRAKNTAISIASDVDYLISMTNTCEVNGDNTLKALYESLYGRLHSRYGESRVRSQNVSVRVTLGELKVDVTPAKKHIGNTNDHSLYLSKKDTWRKTNIQVHITDISRSGRTNEICLLKIWRELHKLDFPSIYMEYLLVNHILHGHSKTPDQLSSNMSHVFSVLAMGEIFNVRVVDPGNSTNVLSDLLDTNEKKQIMAQALKAHRASNWNEVVW